MFKKIISNQQGLTFIELMIAIAIIIIISALSLVYIRGNVIDDVHRSADQLMADMRYTRNLAASRTAYDFSGNTNPDVKALGNIYPPGGYGIAFDKTARTYTIFADSDVAIDGNPVGYDNALDPTVKMVTIENNSLVLSDANSEWPFRHFTFLTEKDAVTNLLANSDGQYQVMIDFPAVDPNPGYKSIITIGELSSDGHILTALGAGFSEYNAVVDVYVPPKDPVYQIK